jgi:hypothetical protein
LFNVGIGTIGERKSKSGKGERADKKIFRFKSSKLARVWASQSYGLT